MDEKLLNQIPHIDEIAHRGVYNGVGPKHTDRRADRKSQCG